MYSNELTMGTCVNDIRRTCAFSFWKVIKRFCDKSTLCVIILISLDYFNNRIYPREVQTFVFMNYEDYQAGGESFR